MRQPHLPRVTLRCSLLKSATRTVEQNVGRIKQVEEKGRIGKEGWKEEKRKFMNEHGTY